MPGLLLGSTPDSYVFDDREKLSVDHRAVAQRTKVMFMEEGC